MHRDLPLTKSSVTWPSLIWPSLIRCRSWQFSIWLCLLICCAQSSAPAVADPAESPKEFLWNITFRDSDGQTVTKSGRLIVQAADGGILLEEPNGYLLNVIPEAIIQQEQTEETFAYLTADKLAENLKQELGDGFKAHLTEHYVVVSELSSDYTEWAGELLEQMYGQFFREWSNLDFEIHEPRCPLPVLLFEDRTRFNEYVKTELLQETLPNQGFYSVRTNRIVLIDLAEGKAWSEVRRSRLTGRKLGEAMLNTSTIVHEGVHQLCYNCGMMNRFSDVPLWLSEGIALYFETPSLRSRTGWGGVGRINNSRLFRFREFASAERPENSLQQLISSNGRLENAESAAAAYAESWLLVSYLMKRRRKDLDNYLQLVSQKTPFIWDDEERRKADFESTFGKDWSPLDQNLLNFARRLRPSR